MVSHWNILLNANMQQITSPVSRARLATTYSARPIDANTCKPAGQTAYIKPKADSMLRIRQKKEKKKTQKKFV